MPKYTQDVKDRAVEAAKEGISLAEIQRTIGPNPKATQRYLAKVGINYADLRKELVEAGKLKAPFNEQGPKARAKANKAKKQVNVTEEFVLEE